MGMIIAMKGHPGTGKSTVAKAIASALKIPLLDKDDIRDSTLSVQRALDGALLTSPACDRERGDPSPSPSSLLNDLSYEALWRVAATQLGLGLSLVIDSPLSRRAHLDRLLGLAARSGGGAVVVVVECRPSRGDEWRRRLERRGAEGEGEGEGGAWHKPRTWGDMERLVDGYAGCTEYDVGDVQRIVVDTTEEGVSAEELVSSVLDFIRSCGGPSLPLDINKINK